MIPALGRSVILGALLAAAAGALHGFVNASRPTVSGWAWTRRLAYTFAALMISANLLMAYALLARDFSVGYVADVGSRAVPDWVALVSLWSSLEGSILFWGLVLGSYVAVATYLNRDQHPEHMSYAVATWLACAAFFTFLVAGPAQPFRTVSPVPTDGPGPNPLLQNHLLMVFHPPFLYLGYVGMTIPFGFAAAALLTGRLGPGLLRLLRQWLLLPWIFQTVAIVLGGWWAYEVLGWGGYWAWDPVENASFLPWLTAMAAIHSVVLVERKGILKGWTVTLVLTTFLLTVLGTFMTRSGVFNSVHSFTQSAIGPSILVFLAAGLLFSVALLALRIDRLSAEGTIEDARSRDAAILVNNLLLVLFTFTVLLGTVFPLVVEAVRGAQMSVGRPYFDRMAAPLGVALLLLMGICPALPWGRPTGAQLRRGLLSPLAGAAIALLLGLAFGVRNGWVLVTVAFAGYAAQVTLKELWFPVQQRMRSAPGNLFNALLDVHLVRDRRRFGAFLAHAGTVVLFVAIAVSSTMSRSREVQLQRDQTAEVGGYTLRFLGTNEVNELHRRGIVARIAIARAGRDLGVLYPRMSFYESRREPLGTPAVRTSLAEDLYLSVMNLDEDGQSVGLMAMVNPLVAWIWLAAGVMALGALLALLPTGGGAK